MGMSALLAFLGPPHWRSWALSFTSPPPSLPSNLLDPSCSSSTLLDSTSSTLLRWPSPAVKHHMPHHKQEQEGDYNIWPMVDVWTMAQAQEGEKGSPGPRKQPPQQVSLPPPPALLSPRPVLVPPCSLIYGEKPTSNEYMDIKWKKAIMEKEEEKEEMMLEAQEELEDYYPARLPLTSTVSSSSSDNLSTGLSEDSVEDWIEALDEDIFGKGEDLTSLPVMP